MGPVALDALSLNSGAKCGSHVVHTLADDDELIEPLLAKLRSIKDGSSDSSTVLGRRRVVAAHNDLDLGEDASSLLVVSADDGIFVQIVVA